MPSIEEILDVATPSQVMPPNVDDLRRTERRRSRRRRALVAVTGGCLALAVTLVAWTSFGTGQHVESVDQAPVYEREQGTPRTTGVPDSLGGQEPPTTEPIWASRWFLVPNEPTEIDYISGQSVAWEDAQSSAIVGPLLTDNPDDPATAGLAWIYHLEDVSIFGIGSPEWDYYETTVSGRQVRVGNEPGSDRINAFVASATGSFVLVGVGLTDNQATDLVLRAGLVAGATSLAGPLPVGFTEVAQPTPDPAEHRTEIGWQQDGLELRLSISRSSLEEQTVLRRSREATLVEVRATSAVYTGTEPGIYPANLIWTEGGYAFVLSTMDDQEPGDLDTLLSVAESLQRIDQAGLIERLDDPFMPNQSTLIAEWITATPPPPGWDTTSLINGVPQGELMAASLVRQYLECSWITEWATAVRANDVVTRAEAEAVLAEQLSWPVFEAEIDAQSQIDEQSAGHQVQLADSINSRTEQMAATRTPEDLTEFERNYGCGFVKPPG